MSGYTTRVPYAGAVKPRFDDISPPLRIIQTVAYTVQDSGTGGRVGQSTGKE